MTFEPKDWILFFAPLVLSGLLVFILQIIYERRQSIRREYSAKFRDILDKSLDSYARSTIQGEPNVSKLRQQFYQGAIDSCNFYLANHKVFKKFQQRIFKLRDLLCKLGNIAQDHYTEEMSVVMSEMYSIMLSLKEDCMFYKF